MRRGYKVLIWERAKGDFIVLDKGEVSDDIRARMLNYSDFD